MSPRRVLHGGFPLLGHPGRGGGQWVRGLLRAGGLCNFCACRWAARVPPPLLITKKLRFIMCHSMREASRLKLQFVPEHSYISRFLGAPLLKFVSYWIHFYHAILIMVLRYVYKYNRFLFFRHDA